MCFRLVFFLFVAACGIRLGAQDGQVVLLTFIDNADQVQKQFDVKCLVLSSTELHPPEKNEPTMHITSLQITKDSEMRRNDVIVSQLDIVVGKASATEVRSEISFREGVLFAGDSDVKETSEISLWNRPDPLSMLMLSMDSQANGKGATQDACMDLFKILDYVETRKDQNKNYSVWIANTRTSIIEVAFSDGEEMPHGFKHFACIDDKFPENDERDGRYVTSGKLFSDAKISWKKLGKLFVPSKLLMSRGWKGTHQVKQDWQFFEWRIGDDVDRTSLDRQEFANLKSYRRMLIDLNDKLTESIFK